MGVINHNMFLPVYLTSSKLVKENELEGDLEGFSSTNRMGMSF